MHFILWLIVLLRNGTLSGKCLPDLNCFPIRIVAGHMFPLPQTDQLLMGSLVVLHRRLWRTHVWIVSMTSVLYIHHCAARMPNMFNTTSEKLIAVYSPPLRGWIQGKVSKDGCVSTFSGPGTVFQNACFHRGHTLYLVHYLVYGLGHSLKTTCLYFSSWSGFCRCPWCWNSILSHKNTLKYRSEILSL